MFCRAGIAALVESAGFAVEGVLGGVDGRPIALDSPRCIVIARRPGPASTSTSEAAP